MIDILGLGWLNDQCYGQGRNRSQVDYANRVSLERLGFEDNLFRETIKNFGRFEALTQKLFIATTLALRDAGLTNSEQLHEIGLLAINKTGCIASNQRFFQDYLDGGRKLSRANLFIYTLPSSPIAEAAIYFGFRGPLLYIDAMDESMNSEIQTVENLLQTAQAKFVLINLIDEFYQAALIVRIGKAATEHFNMSFLPENIAECAKKIKEASERT
ncbi:MAG: hypothetical protein JXA96_16370 [Sedimentisphaerales bacterium]|nr:hypothetical protein [Sedimentisphaerales bacterium]